MIEKKRKLLQENIEIVNRYQEKNFHIYMDRLYLYSYDYLLCLIQYQKNILPLHNERLLFDKIDMLKNESTYIVNAFFKNIEEIKHIYYSLGDEENKNDPHHLVTLVQYYQFMKLFREKKELITRHVAYFGSQKTLYKYTYQVEKKMLLTEDVLWSEDDFTALFVSANTIQLLCKGVSLEKLVDIEKNKTFNWKDFFEKMACLIDLELPINDLIELYTNRKDSLRVLDRHYGILDELLKKNIALIDIVYLEAAVLNEVITHSDAIIDLLGTDIFQWLKTLKKGEESKIKSMIRNTFAVKAFNELGIGYQELDSLDIMLEPALNHYHILETVMSLEVSFSAVIDVSQKAPEIFNNFLHNKSGLMALAQGDDFFSIIKKDEHLLPHYLAEVNCCKAVENDENIQKIITALKKDSVDNACLKNRVKGLKDIVSIEKMAIKALEKIAENEKILNCILDNSDSMTMLLSKNSTILSKFDEHKDKGVLFFNHILSNKYIVDLLKKNKISLEELFAFEFPEVELPSVILNDQYVQQLSTVGIDMESLRDLYEPWEEEQNEYMFRGLWIAEVVTWLLDLKINLDEIFDMDQEDRNILPDFYFFKSQIAYYLDQGVFIRSFISLYQKKGRENFYFVMNHPICQWIQLHWSFPKEYTKGVIAVLFFNNTHGAGLSHSILDTIVNFCSSDDIQNLKQVSQVSGEMNKNGLLWSDRKKREVIKKEKQLKPVEKISRFQANTLF